MTESSPPVGARSNMLRDERGLGLPELLVAMFLLAVMMTLVVSAFSTFTSSFTRDRAATDSTSAASIGMNELTRVIRSGTEIPIQGQNLNDPVFESVGPEGMVLHAYLDTESTDPRPVKVQFAVNGDRDLVETRWLAKPLPQGYWGFETTSDYTRVIARDLVVPSAAEPPLFTYVMVDESTTTTPTPAQLRSIAAVEVTLEVQTDVAGRADPVKISNRVGMPNLGVSRVGP